jgi:hypothetical protein
MDNFHRRMKKRICPFRYETIIMTLELQVKGQISEECAEVFIRYALMPYRDVFNEFCQIRRQYD